MTGALSWTKNRHGYKGVFYNARRGWCACFHRKGIQKNTRWFKTAVEAAAAYDDLAKTYGGENEYMNVPLNGEVAVKVIADERVRFCHRGHEKNNNYVCETCGRAAFLRFHARRHTAIAVSDA
jgi:hypothetical protein